MAQPGFMADSGFPNFYFNESYPDLSSDLGRALPFALFGATSVALSDGGVLWTGGVAGDGVLYGACGRGVEIRGDDGAERRE